MTVHMKDKKITILVVENERSPNRKRITIEYPLPGGEYIWAYYRKSSGNEYMSSLTASEQVRVDAIFEINWRDDINETMKILFRGKKYDITRIDDFEGYKNTLTINASLTE